MAERITPRDVAELVYGEHSPIATMDFEEAKDHIEKVVTSVCEDYYKERVTQPYNTNEWIEWAKKYNILNKPWLSSEKQDTRTTEPWPLSFACRK